MEKVKRKNIFKTFALGFTSLALMLGVFLGNALPQVKAEEPLDYSDYYTAEKLEEIKTGEINLGDLELQGKHLLFDVTDFEEDYSMDPTLIDMAGEDDEGYLGQINISYENKVVDVSSSVNASTSDITWKYFVGGDSREYVYLCLNNIPDGYEVMILKEGYAWYISEAIEEPTVNEDKPSNNRPTTNNKTEDDEKTDTGCGSFFEDVGVVVNEVLKIEDTDPFATGIVTISILAILLVITLVAIKK